MSRDVIAVAQPAQGPPRWDVDFWIAEADLAARTAGESGGTVLSEPADDPALPFRRATLADPGGAVFTISQFLAR